MTVKSFKASSVEALENQLSQLCADGFTPTVAIAFSSLIFDFQGVSSIFKKHGIDVFGCSTAGEILDDEVYDHVTVGLLLDIDPQCFSIYFSEYGGKGVFQTGKEAGMLAREKFANPALIVGSGGVAIDAEQIVFGLQAGAGPDVPIYGGLAADDLTFVATSVFDKNKVTDNGMVVLILDADKIEVKGMATSGWEGVGMENIITKAEGNVVYAINDEPALDVFIKYFGYFDNSEVKGKTLSTISAQYPLQIIREDGTTVLRSPLMGDDHTRTLTLAGGVREGDRFRFSIIPGFEVIDQTIEDFSRLRKEAEDADALILFSCKGRHAALGPLIEDEVKGIYNFWKKPMAGFFTYGEIGPTPNGTCEFHNETCSLVLLKEK
jgi:hypothetical protein